MNSLFRVASECGNTPDEAWKRLRSNTHFYKEDKSLLNLHTYTMIEKPNSIDFLGIGQLMSLEQSEFSKVIASCYEDKEGEYIFIWLA